MYYFTVTVPAAKVLAADVYFWLTSSAIKQVPASYPACAFCSFRHLLSLHVLTVICLFEVWGSSVINVWAGRLEFDLILQIPVKKLLSLSEKRPERQADNWLSSIGDFEYACVSELLPPGIILVLWISSLVTKYHLAIILTTSIIRQNWLLNGTG